ncbi:hypothetical protein NPIL_168641 [Nephila pilipes]|uniref:Uncharacterized protein n=1 Tax=Nephila pilipes TaxID=299642 RepID=A0A8X6NU50_NEPPI|nr:hypothetical protein NPIL_168641 [Nephila pilipes]
MERFGPKQYLFLKIKDPSSSLSRHTVCTSVCSTVFFRLLLVARFGNTIPSVIPQERVNDARFELSKTFNESETRITTTLKHQILYVPLSLERSECHCKEF